MVLCAKQVPWAPRQRGAHFTSLEGVSIRYAFSNPLVMRLLRRFVYTCGEVELRKLLYQRDKYSSFLLKSYH